MIRLNSRWFDVLQTLGEIVKDCFAKSCFFIKIDENYHKFYFHRIEMSQIDTILNPVRDKLAPPKRFGVYLHNDDYTTMDFVVEILSEVFRLPEQQAVAIMLEVHHHGKGLCGTYTRDIAETKQQQVQNRATEAGFPLLCTVEELT